MAGVSSLGIGTGIDLQSMLKSIMDSERAPIKAIESKVASANAKISIYGTVNLRLSTLKSATDNLKLPSQLAAVGAKSSDADVLGVSAAFTAAIGSYKMNVTQLASAQKSFSNEYAGNTTFGAGKLTFDVGGAAKEVDIADGATLSQVSASINEAKIGVTATVVTTAGGAQRMILTGEKSGDDNDFSITSSTATPSAGASLADFDSTTLGLNRTTAQNAIMEIDGIEVTSSTNTFTSAVTGLTLTAKKTGEVNVAVEKDSAKIKTAVQAFVDSFNGLATTIKNNSGYDSATKTGQPLAGDSSIRSVMSSLNNARSTPPSSLSGATLKNLYDIGITIQQSGELKFDSTKLETALATSPEGVTNMLKAYGEAFSNTIEAAQSSEGLVGNRISNLKTSVTRYNANIESLERRMDIVEKRYRAQFTALDKYVNSMQTTSGYLGQQLTQLSNTSR